VLPERDRISQYKKQLLAQISFLFGGRIAEEIFVHDISTGAANDFERATQLARMMVTRFGMSDLMGPMVYGENDGEVFLGRSITTHKNVSEAVLQQVDAEIRRIIDEQYAVARKLIEDNRDKIEMMVKALLDWETIDADQVKDIMEGRTPRPPKPASTPTPSKPSSGGGGEGATAPAPSA
jgi:cell division protease FtsH